MERLSDTAIEIINDLHTERLEYASEYILLIDAANRLSAYEDTGLEPEKIKDFMKRWKRSVEISELCKMGGIDHLLELKQAENDGWLVVLNKDYAEKDGEEALRRAMWQCNNDNPELLKGGEG